MTIKSIKPQDFASAGNYPAGTDDWSGQPRIVTMTASEKAQGFTPNTPVTAERRNGLHAEHFTANALLFHRALREWSKEELPVTAGGRSVLFDFLVPITQSGSTQRPLVALGYDQNDTNDLMYMRSFGAGFFESSVRDPANGDGARGATRGTFGEWLMFGAGALVGQYLGFGATINNLGGNFDWVAAHYMPGTGIYLGACSNGSFDRTNDLTLGGGFPFTNVATTATARTAASLSTPQAEFADDGSSHVVCVGVCTVGGVSAMRVFSSSNSGTSWTNALTLTGSSAANVIWQSQNSQFICIDWTAGKVYTSPDGATWSAPTTISLAVSNGATARYGTMACIGDCIVKAVKINQFSTFDVAGAAYSFDAGATWARQLFADADGIAGFEFGLYSVVAANGRFYATDRSRIYRSGLVGFDDAKEYT